MSPIFAVPGSIFFPAGPFLMHTPTTLKALAVVALLIQTADAMADKLEEGARAVLGGDFERAAQLWKEAADEGNHTAECKLSAFYLGKDTPLANDTEAAKWTMKCASSGHPRGQAVLGWMYMQGRGVPQHYKEGARWLKRAAEGGDGWAQIELAHAHLQGRGVLGDLVVAHMWLNLASVSEESTKEQRDSARSERDDLAKKMSARQVELAQSLAASWQAGPGSPKPHDTYLERVANEPGGSGDYGVAIARSVIGTVRYPRRAQQLGWQGTTLVAVEISADGKLRNVSVAKSSGYDVLDEEAIERVRRIRELPPIPDKHVGRTFTAEVPIVFRLD